MPAHLEKLKGLERKLNVTVPADQFEAIYQKHLSKAAKEAKMPGFRAGKVPAKVLEQKYGKGLEQDAANELIQASLMEAVHEHKLEIAGQPIVDSINAKKGEPLEYSVKFEVYPEIKLNSLDKCKVERLKAEIKDADVDQMIETLRKQNANWEKVERAAKEGDKLVIDFEGFIDGKPFQGNKAEKFTLELGSNQMIPGFEAGMVGMKAGDEKDVNVTFPLEYPAEEVKGKEAVFKIKAHEVMGAKLPEVDMEFIKKLGFATLESMRKEVQDSMELETSRVLFQRLKMQVLDELMKANKIEIPAALLEVEIKHLQSQTRNQIAQQIGNKEQAEKIELPRENYLKEAEKRVTLGLLVGEFIKENKITVDAEIVKKKIEEIANHYQEPEKVVSWYYGDKQQLAQVESVVLEDTAVDKMLSQMQVSDKTLSYQDALKQPQKK